MGGLGARWVGSATITTAMIASILTLVPGVPAVNALSDILEGHPTLGSARAVTVVVILIFVAAGLWLGNAWLKEWQCQRCYFGYAPRHEICITSVGRQLPRDFPSSYVHAVFPIMA
jgi:hypothetical protein